MLSRTGPSSAVAVARRPRLFAAASLVVSGSSGSRFATTAALSAVHQSKRGGSIAAAAVARAASSARTVVSKPVEVASKETLAPALAEFYTPEFVRRAVFRRYSNGAIWVGFATIGGALAGLLVIPDEPSGNSKPMATWLTDRQNEATKLRAMPEFVPYIKEADSGNFGGQCNKRMVRRHLRRLAFKDDVINAVLEPYGELESVDVTRAIGDAQKLADRNSITAIQDSAFETYVALHETVVNIEERAPGRQVATMSTTLLRTNTDPRWIPEKRALTWSVPLSVTLGTSIAAALSWGAAYVRYKTRPEELVRYMSKGSGAGFGLKWLFPTAGLLPWGMLMGFGLTFGACSVVLPDLVDFNDHPWSDAEVYSVRTLKTQYVMSRTGVGALHASFITDDLTVAEYLEREEAKTKAAGVAGGEASPGGGGGGGEGAVVEGEGDDASLTDQLEDLSWNQVAAFGVDNMVEYASPLSLSGLVICAVAMVAIPIATAPLSFPLAMMAGRVIVRRTERMVRAESLAVLKKEYRRAMG